MLYILRFVKKRFMFMKYDFNKQGVGTQSARKLS